MWQRYKNIQIYNYTITRSKSHKVSAISNQIYALSYQICAVSNQICVVSKQVMVLSNQKTSELMQIPVMHLTVGKAFAFISALALYRVEIQHIRRMVMSNKIPTLSSVLLGQPY